MKTPKIFAFLWKWSFCYFFHPKCHPTVWGPETAKEWGIPYRPNAWHCHKCHHCNEGLKEVFGEFED